jgi:site-specific recombinase XerD
MIRIMVSSNLAINKHKGNNMPTITFSSQYGGFQVKFRDSTGKPQRKSLGKATNTAENRQEAVAKAAEIGFPIETTSTHSTPKPEDTSSLDGWISLYLKRKTKCCSPDSISSMHSILRQFQAFAKKKRLLLLGDVTIKDVNEWVDTLTLHPSSVVTKLVCLSGLFTMAIEDERLVKHPVRFPLKMAREAFKAFKKTQDKTPKHYNADQQRELWAVLDSDPKVDPDIRDIMVLMSVVGLRIKAATLIEFESSELDILHVPPVLDKGGHGCDVLLFPRAQEVFQRRKKTLKSGRVFPGINHTYVWHYIRTILQRNKLTEHLKLGHFCHVHRHTCAMGLVGQIPIQVLQKQLGHANIASTMIYAQVDNDVLRSAMAKVKL